MRSGEGVGLPQAPASAARSPRECYRGCTVPSYSAGVMTAGCCTTGTVWDGDVAPVTVVGDPRR